MTKRGHLRIFLIATVVWAAFWVAGLPSYYQQYSVNFMGWFATLLLLFIPAILYRVLRPVHPKRRMATALWLAFYFTVPLALYDWLYCGLYLGHGIQFLTRYWYLTVYYAIPWILLPLVAFHLNSISADLRRSRERPSD